MSPPSWHTPSLQVRTCSNIVRKLRDWNVSYPVSAESEDCGERTRHHYLCWCLSRPACGGWKSDYNLVTPSDLTRCHQAQPDTEIWVVWVVVTTSADSWLSVHIWSRSQIKEHWKIRDLPSLQLFEESDKWKFCVLSWPQKPSRSYQIFFVFA